MLDCFVRDERGNIAILFAIAFGLGVVLAALAVDEGSLYLERREVQTAVDLAAIAAARDPAGGQAIALAVLRQMGAVPDDIDAATLADPDGETWLAVAVGRYDANPVVSAAQRFVAGAVPTNAVRVSYRRMGRQFFSAGWSNTPAIGAHATAAINPQVVFSVGSRLARLEGGLANLLLNRLLGTEVGLSLIDYEALASVEISLFAFLDSLATQLGITAGTYRDLMSLEARQGDVAAALGRLLNGSAGAAAMSAAANSSRTGTFPVGKLVDLGQLAGLSIFGSRGHATIASVNALELLTASASLADGSSQASANLAATLPGLAGIVLQIVIGEPAQSATWFAVGPGGTVVRTAQLRLRLRADLLGGPSLLGAGVTLPLGVDIAYAEASVHSATCPTESAPNGTATISARPGIARLFIGQTRPEPASRPSPPSRPPELSTRSSLRWRPAR